VPQDALSGGTVMADGGGDVAAAGSWGTLARRGALMGYHRNDHITSAVRRIWIVRSRDGVSDTLVHETDSTSV
jgi:hypothetical protein